MSALKGKTFRRTPAPANREEMQIPQHVKELNNRVVLSIDIFFVNGIPLFYMVSQVLCFVTVTHLVDKKVETIYKALRGIVKYYFQRGYKITRLVE